jgi:hypothetical protein
MSNEDLYDNDLDLMDVAADGDLEDSLGADEFEIELHRRSPKGDVFLQIFPRTRYWIRYAVRPEEIIREDKEDSVFVFVKQMKDPNFISDDGSTRHIKYRCSIALSELEVEMSFSHLELYYADAEGNLSEAETILEDTKEAAEVKVVFDKVIDHLSAYLSKS